MAARRGLLLALLAAVIATPALAKSPPAPTAQEQAAITRAVERGRLIYAFDQAAWHSTDELLRKVPKTMLPAIRGWVTEPRGDLLRVTYYDVDGETPRALFQADMRGAAVARSHLFGEGEDRTLSPETLALIQARTTALRAGEGKARCTSGRFNVVVLPQGAGEPAAVYLLTPMETKGEYPFGGNYEVDVGPDGKVVSERAFTKACLNMALPPPNPAGEPMAMVSHMLDPTPTEIHVFMSLWMGKPVVVLTGKKQAWAVSGDQISAIPLK